MLLHFLSSSPQLRSQACHNAAPPLRCVGCCSFVTPEGIFFFYPAPGQRFKSRLQPGALRDAARGLLSAPPCSALPPGHSRHRGHPLPPRHRCCGHSGRHEAAANFGGGERGRGSAPRPAAMAAGGSAPTAGAARAPCCEGAEGPGRAAGGPAGSGERCLLRGGAAVGAVTAVGPRARRGRGVLRGSERAGC